MLFFFQTIHSVLEPNIGEEMLLARIIDLEREYDRQGSPSENCEAEEYLVGRAV